MSATPAPRPALRKAADATIHPAAPGAGPHLLRHPVAGPPTAPAAPTAPEPGGTAGAPGGKDAQRRGSTLSGPLSGTTSDSLRSAGRRAGDRKVKAKKGDKLVTLSVEVPRSLRKEFEAALKADGKKANAVVAGLLRSWLDG